MTSPKRRPLTLANLDVTSTLERAVKQGPEIELGWSVLKDEMRDAGWQSRTPEGDRKPGQPCRDHDDPDRCTCNTSVDYSDVTGDMAMRLSSLADDLDTMQSHWFLVQTSLRAMAKIAARHRPPAVPAVPCCSVSQCGDAVESRVGKHGLVYVGMEQIAGLWVAPAGSRPTCARHRRMRRVA